MSNTVLATVSEFTEYMGLDGSQQEPFLQKVLNRAYAYLNSRTNRTLETTTHTEDHDGDGSDSIALKNFPITSVTSVHDDIDRNFADATLIPASSYAIDTVNGMIRLIRNPSIRFGTGEDS